MQDKNGTSGRRRNLQTLFLTVGIVLGMSAMSYAAVPLYRMFCQVTGYGGTTQRAEMGADRVLDREITVRFDANTLGVPWIFEPEQRSVTMKLGETVQVAYRAKNRSSRPNAGSATFNVTPELAGAYFNKIECFCFTQTELKAGEDLDMPVVFFVDPDILEVPELKDIETITLSYTFYPLDRDEDEVASAPSVGSSADTNP